VIGRNKTRTRTVNDGQRTSIGRFQALVYSQQSVSEARLRMRNQYLPRIRHRKVSNWINGRRSECFPDLPLQFAVRGPLKRASSVDFVGTINRRDWVCPKESSGLKNEIIDDALVSIGRGTELKWLFDSFSFHHFFYFNLA
jgi:hypothetical protein